MKFSLLLPLLLLLACANEPSGAEIATPDTTAATTNADAISDAAPVRDVEAIKVGGSSAEPAAPAPKTTPTSPRRELRAEPAATAAPAPTRPTRHEAETRPQPTPVKVEAAKSRRSEAPRSETAPPPQTTTPKPPAQAAYPVLTFKSTLWNFGELDEGTTVDHKFEFTNTGDAPLEITNTEATCGCTKPLFPFVPIQPGETSYISVRYNSTGKFGNQRPKVTVYANTREKKHLLYLEGSVKTEVVRN